MVEREAELLRTLLWLDPVAFSVNFSPVEIRDLLELTGASVLVNLVHAVGKLLVKIHPTNKRLSTGRVASDWILCNSTESA
jgi:hypothetical protein